MNEPTRPAEGPEQLIFPLPHVTSLDREAFVVSPSNQVAVALIDRWPEWPPSPRLRAVMLVGPSGSGKSHLMAAWRARSAAPILTPAMLHPGEPPGELSALAVDNADQLVASGQDHAESLLHWLNVVTEAGGTALLTGQTPPATWPVALADLASRLRALPVAELGDPDDALLSAVIVKQLADRQLSGPPELIAFVLSRIERSHAAVQRFVETLDRMALQRRQALTVPLARQVLAKMEPPR